MAEQNPFDVGTRRRRTYADTYGYNPLPTDVGTGIPTESSYPNTGINPGGMYSGTQAGIPAPTSTAAPSTAPTAPVAPQYSQYAMPGWDQSKWADTSHTTPKYQVGRILSQYPSTPQGLQQALPAIQAAFPGASLVGNDKLQIPGVGLIDVGIGFSAGGNRGWQWGALTDQYGNPISDGTSGTGTGTSGSGGGFNDAIRQQLMAIMNQSSDPTKSGTYRGAVNAYGAQQQRNAEHERNAIAERMAAGGQANSGALDTRLIAAEQARGENTASFAGDLAVRMLQSQRDQIMQALQMGANLMTEEQRLALQEKLGMIDANLQGQSLGLQQQQITNQNNQFNSNMGWNQAQWEYLMNQQPWNTVLG